jgi:hypothetical protein
LEAAETGQAAVEVRDIRLTALAHPVAAAGPACIAPSISGGSPIRRLLSPLRRRKFLARIDVCRAVDVLNAHLTIGPRRYLAFIHDDTLAANICRHFIMNVPGNLTAICRQRVVF